MYVCLDMAGSSRRHPELACRQARDSRGGSLWDTPHSFPEELGVGDVASGSNSDATECNNAHAGVVVRGCSNSSEQP
jgi:hypothetical protein